MGVPDEISELVRNSGNNFHAKVARWLSDNDWHVVVSPYYMDQTQNKAREIDLIAEKLWPVTGHWQGKKVGDVAARLFIECKFVPSHSVFWFADKDLDSAQQLVCGSGNFDASNIHTKEHHYLAQGSKVAKLFETSPRKSPENDPFYKALNQVLNAMISMRDKPVSVPKLKRLERSPLEILEFPVVVCSSFEKMYSLDFFMESEPDTIKDNFQLEIRYAYIDRHNNQRDDYFLLDFVEFSQLEKFAEAIEHDAQISTFLASYE